MRNTADHKKSAKATRTIKSALLFFATIFIFAQCGNKEQEVEESMIRELEPASIVGIRIVHANIDSIIYRYNYAIDVNKELIDEERRIEYEIAKKTREIKEYRNRRLNAGTFQEYKKITQEIVDKEEELVRHKIEVMEKFNSQAHAKDQEIRDSITNYLKEYNRSKGYDYILTRFDDNMFYANKSLDITDEIIEGLNSRYTPKK